MKGIVKALLRRTPYRIVRAGALNRFNAVDELLPVLRDRGFRPTRVIDGGANVGAFARGAKSVFPDFEIEMIEPQPACHEALRRLELETGYTFHPVALVGPVHMKPSIDLNVSPGEATTGAHVSATPNETAVSVPAATLDATLDGRLGDHEQIFMKLDLQGYEMEALAGGERTLMQTEVILTEVSFFAQAYEPPISQIISFLDARNFELYDIAALAARSRDGRARQGDFLFVRRDSRLMADTRWS